MFIRETKSKGKTYLHILQSYWRNGASKHKLIASLGATETLKKTGELQKIAHALLRYCNENQESLNLDAMEEQRRVRWGAVSVFEKIWRYFDFQELFKTILKKRKIKFDFFSAVFLMALDRLLDPKSKRKSCEEQTRYHGIQDQALQHLYRALDLLSESKETIEAYLFKKNRTLWNMKVDVVLYDVTTFYFESVKADALRDFGYGKDGKWNEVQVVVGLLVDLEGRPIGLDLFPGNTYEGHTMKVTLEKLRERFQINRIIMIADQGMLSKDNIASIRESGYEYIIGGKIKTKPKNIQAAILNPKGYIKIPTTNIQEDAEILKFKKIKLDSDYLICTWSEKRAKKDKKDRERLIEKAQKIIGEKKGSIVSRRGALKYIGWSAKLEGRLDEKKITEEQKWDGYYGIQTNCENLAPQNLLGYYRNLWKIEESFRIFKTHLETRPLFHWTPKRIQGHFVLCFIAFLLERTLEIELKKKQVESSPERIRKALDELQYSEIVIQNQTFFLRSPVTGLANDILCAMKLKIPPQITKPDKFSWT